MHNKSWVRLLSFCVAAVLAGSVAIALLLAGASLAFGSGTEAASAQDSASQVTISGVISDSRCGAKHAADSGKSPAECARFCVRRGARYVVVDGDTTYMLAGSRTSLDAFAGQRVKVKGSLSGDTFKVASIESMTELGTQAELHKK